MRVAHLFKLPSILIATTALVACTAAIEAEWETIFNPRVEENPDRLAWLDDMEIDSYGNLVIGATTIVTTLGERSQDFVIARLDDRGNVLGFQDYDLSSGSYISEESVLKMALDSSDNVYALLQEYRRVPDVSFTSHNQVAAIDPTGTVLWTVELGQDVPYADLKIANGKLYVTGPDTRIFSLSGELLQTISHNGHDARSIDVNLAGDILLGGGSETSLYRADGTKVWNAPMADQEYSTFGEAKFTMSGDIVSTDSQEASGSMEIARYTAQGQKLWSRSFGQPYQSYSLISTPMVFEDSRGDLIVTASNEEGSRVVKLNSAGRLIWNTRARKGLIREAALKDGELFVVGSGNNAKYDRDGNRIAESEAGRYVQITTGSIALDGDKIYAGYSVDYGSTFAMQISQYLDR